MYVIVTNHVHWLWENLQSDRENTGNLKMEFEWVYPVPIIDTTCFIDFLVDEVAIMSQAILLDILRISYEK